MPMIMHGTKHTTVSFKLKRPKTEALTKRLERAMVAVVRKHGGKVGKKWRKKK